MKILLKLILAFLIFSGCNENNKQKLKEVSKYDTVIKTENIIVKPPIISKADSIKMEYLNELIPIDTVDAKSKNVYKKYGMEMNGNCYACDLANLSITEKLLKLTNVCDKKINQVYTVVEVSYFDNGIKIRTKENDFVIKKIDEAPIYELKINDKNIKNKNLRISKYYTLKKILNKFVQHDCGDFEG